MNLQRVVYQQSVLHDFGDDDLVLFFGQQANAACSVINDSINWVDGSYVILFCDEQDDMQLLTDTFCATIVGDKATVDCNDFDLTNNYNRGNVELECVSHETLEVINNT